ncbi:MAG: DUF4397 domain-containing protein [Chloroflexota bacterium]|nr:DUF4397 domain-containing protein [Chloroflexota bacterium]
MRNRLQFLLIITVISLLAACAPAPVPTQTPVPPPSVTPMPTLTPTPEVPRTVALTPGELASVRLVHAVPDAGMLDVYAEQLAIATQIDYTQAAEAGQIAAGDYTLRVFPAGTTPDDEPLLEAPLTLEGKESYTLIISPSGDGLRLVTHNDDLSPLASGRSRMVFIHAAAGTPAVSVGFAGSVPLLTDLNFEQVSPAITLESERQTLEIRSSGALLIDDTLQLREGRGYTIILTGAPQNTGNVQLITFEYAIPGEARARVISGLDADAGAVDVYIGDTLLAQSLVFGSASDLVTIPAEAGSLHVRTSGAAPGDTPLYSISVAPNNGDQITYLITGEANNIQMLTHVDNALTTLPEGRMSVTFVNLYAGAERLSSYSLDGPLSENIDMRYADSPFTIIDDPGTQIFFWQSPAEGGRREVAYRLEDTRTFEANTRYLYIITGREDAPVLMFELPLTERATRSALPDVAELRFVNTIPDTRATFALDDEPLLEQLPGGSSSDLVSVPQATYNLTVSTGSATLTESVTLSSFNRYSIYAYGTDFDVRLLIIEDDSFITNSNQGNLRFVNIGQQGEAAFDLGSVVSPTGNLNPDAAPSYAEGEPQSIPFGVQRLYRNTAVGTASLVARLEPVVHDFYFIDPARDGVVATLQGIDIQAGQAIEIVIVQSIEDERFNIFVLPYPTFSDNE